MKQKIIVSLFAISILISSSVTPVLAAMDNGTVTQNEFNDTDEIMPRVAQYVWTNTALNVRSGPGVKYSIVKTLPKNKKLWITFAQYDEYGNDWYKCIAEGGWVCANYVRYSE